MLIWRTPQALLKLARSLTWVGFLAATLPIVLLAPLVALDASARQLFGVALPGTLEIGEYTIFAITFMAGPWLLRQRRHVRLETLLMATSGRLRAIIESCGFAIGAATSGLMVWEGFWLVLESLRDNTILYGEFSVPAFWMYLFIPIGSFLYLIEFCCLAVDSLRKNDSVPPLEHGRHIGDLP